MESLREPLDPAVGISVGVATVTAVILSRGWWNHEKRLAVVMRLGQLSKIWLVAAMRREPAAIVSACEASGPVFIKLAQWLSTRKDILSPELCEAMGCLHEQVACVPNQDDRLAAEADVTGLVVGEMLGGGCIAQVYAGKLQCSDGSTREVAVKVRRRAVVDLLHTDLIILHYAAQLVESVWPHFQWLSMPDAVEQFGMYLMKQVDFRVEASNLQRFGRNIDACKARVPKVLAASECVLVTDLVHGISLSHFLRQPQYKAFHKAVFRLLSDLIACMALRDKFVHGDLHPGNIMVSLASPDSVPTITLIDAGIAIEVSESMQTCLKAAFVAAFHMNVAGLGKALVSFHHGEGLCTHAADLAGLEHKLGCIGVAGCFTVDKSIWAEVFSDQREYLGARTSHYFDKMLVVLSAHQVRVSPTFWALLTAFALVEGSMKELGHQINILRMVTPYVFSFENVFGRIKAAVRCALSERASSVGSKPTKSMGCVPIPNFCGA